MSQRSSCESGFNDNDDDAVFVVVADVENPSEQRRRILLAEHSEALQSLLHVPSPSSAAAAPKQRVCKSVSDAAEVVMSADSPCAGTPPPMTFHKSTSDTCLRHQPAIECILEANENDDVEDGEVQKKGRSFKHSILNKIFARSRDKERTHYVTGSAGSSAGTGVVKRGSQDVAVSRRSDDYEHINVKGDSDVSDSGLVSGVLESPKACHTLPRKKSKRSDSVVYQMSGSGRADERLSSLLSTDMLHKSSSDPCLDETKSKKRSKFKLKHRKSAIKNSRRYPLNDARDDIDASAASTAKMKPFPSVEKLDFDLRRDRANSDTLAKKRHKRDKLLRLHSDNDVLDYDVFRCSRMGEADGAAAAHKSLSASPSPRLPTMLYRSVSDPNLTFKKIEERVVQRSLTRKWTRTQKMRRKRKSRRRPAEDSTRSLDSLDNNEPGSNDWIQRESKKKRGK